MRGVLHGEVFGFNFSADINPYQRNDDCVIAAGQIAERPHDIKAVRYTQHPHSGVKGKFVVKLTSLPRLIGIPMVCVCDAALLMMGLQLRWGRAEGLRPRSVRMSTPECVDLKKV